MPYVLLVDFILINGCGTFLLLQIDNYHTIHFGKAKFSKQAINSTESVGIENNSKKITLQTHSVVQ